MIIDFESVLAVVTSIINVSFVNMLNHNNTLTTEQFVMMSITIKQKLE